MSANKPIPEVDDGVESAQSPALATPPGPRDRDSLRELRRNPLQFFLNLSRNYGDVVQFRAGFWPAYLVNHPDHIQHVLRDSNRIYSKDTFAYTMTTAVFGESSMFIAQGAVWQRIRRLSQPAFHQQRIEAIGEVVTGLTLKMLQGWEAYSDQQKPLNIEEEMMHLTLEIVGQTLFHIDFNPQVRSIVEAITTINVNMRPGFPKLNNAQLHEALQTLDTAIYAIIRERRQQQVDHGDLLSMLMLAQDADTGEYLTDTQIRDQVVTMIIPAEETTSTALSWTWYLLGQHPDIESQLRHELSEVLAGRLPTIADLPRLPYLRMVFEEALRFYPPIWIMSRKATQEDVIGGYTIPVNAFVAMSPYTMHRHPDYWQNPDQFDPQHFSPEQVAARPRYAYYPFGGGPRGCIGEAFALTEALLIMATVMQRYRLSLVADYAVEPDTVYTLRPSNGVLVTLQPA